MDWNLFYVSRNFGSSTQVTSFSYHISSFSKSESSLSPSSVRRCFSFDISLLVLRIERYFDRWRVSGCFSYCDDFLLSLGNVYSIADCLLLAADENSESLRIGLISVKLFMCDSGL